MYTHFLSETDLHTRDFVHKSYEREITARDVDFVQHAADAFLKFRDFRRPRKRFSDPSATYFKKTP